MYRTELDFNGIHKVVCCYNDDAVCVPIAKRQWYCQIWFHYCQFISTVHLTRILTCSTSQSLSREALNFFIQASARCKWVEYCERKCKIHYYMIYKTYKLCSKLQASLTTMKIKGRILVILDRYCICKLTGMWANFRLVQTKEDSKR